MRSERRFRPMGIRDILDETFDLYKSNFGALLAIVAVVQVPIGAASLYLLSRSDTGPYGSSQLPYALLTFASNFLIAAPATWAVSEAYMGGNPRISAAYRAVVGRALPFIETYILWLLSVTTPLVGAVVLWLMGLAILLAPALEGITGKAPAVMATALPVFALGAAALVVWVVVYVLLIFAPIAFVVEDKHHISALRRSRGLVRNHWWRIFGTISLVLVVVSIVHAGLVTPVRALTNPSGYPIAMAFSMLVALLLWPLPLITTILLYYDLRIRKEGFDLQMLANEMQVSRASAENKMSSG